MRCMPKLCMKLAGRGPVVQLATQASAPELASSGAPFRRDDWNAGRELGDEETRCGLLLCDAAAPRRAVACQRVAAVIKAQTSDFQVNEIDATGAAAFLTRAPKGMWRKLSRTQTLLVENTTAPFSDPSKTFTPRVTSYGTYARHLGRLGHGEDALRFVLYRDGYARGEVLHRFAYELGVSADAVHLRDVPGGHYGCLTQHGVCVGVTREAIPHVSRHYNLHPLLIDPRGYCSLDEAYSAARTSPRGLFYRVLLRCVDAGEDDVYRLLAQLETSGFINYFGVERFGIGGSGLHHMAALAARGDYRGAVGAYLQAYCEAHVSQQERLLAYLNAEESTTAGVVAAWLKHCRVAGDPPRWTNMLQQLLAYHQAPSLDNAHLCAMWQATGLAAMCRRRAAEFVWNAVASQRLLTHGRRVMVGDVVRVAVCGGDEAAEEQQVRRVASAEEAARSTIYDVVLPVPYEASDWRAVCLPDAHVLSPSLYEDFARQHHLCFLFEQTSDGAQADRESRGGGSGSSSSSSASVVYRPLLLRPARLQAAVLHDPSSFASLKTDAFLRQERKAAHSLDLDFAHRVREPCVYNVSERFAERMQCVRQGGMRGPKSVAVGFCLPPHSSPLCALRDVFALHYCNFVDLYSVDDASGAYGLGV